MKERNGSTADRLSVDLMHERESWLCLQAACISSRTTVTTCSTVSNWTSRTATRASSMTSGRSAPNTWNKSPILLLQRRWARKQLIRAVCTVALFTSHWPSVCPASCVYTARSSNCTLWSCRARSYGLWFWVSTSVWQTELRQTDAAYA